MLKSRKPEKTLLQRMVWHSMRFFAVIDTNVLVSASMKPESVPGQVLELVLDGVIVPVLNKAIKEKGRGRPNLGKT